MIRTILFDLSLNSNKYRYRKLGTLETYFLMNYKKNVYIFINKIHVGTCTTGSVHIYLYTINDYDFHIPI